MLVSLRLQSALDEAKALAKEVVSLPTAPDGLRDLLEESVELVAYCGQYPDRLREYREAFYRASALPRCVEDLAPAMNGLIDLAGAFQETVRAVAAALKEAEQARRETERQWGPGMPKADLTVLDATAEALGALQADIEAEWKWLQEDTPLGRPLPTTAESRAALDAGEYIDMADIIAEIYGTRPETW